MTAKQQGRAKKERVDDATRETIRRIAYEHGMSFDDAVTYYIRNND